MRLLPFCNEEHARLERDQMFSEWLYRIVPEQQLIDLNHIPKTNVLGRFDGQQQIKETHADARGLVVDQLAHGRQ